MTTEPMPAVGYLTPEQQQRAAALQEARAALVNRGGPFASSAPDAYDLVTVAMWLISGVDPWAERPTAERPEVPDTADLPVIDLYARGDQS